MKGLEKEREDTRVVYDHYRIKKGKLEKTHMTSPDPKKQEKYQRNVMKFDDAKKRFDDAIYKLERAME